MLCIFLLFFMLRIREPLKKSQFCISRVSGGQTSKAQPPPPALATIRARGRGHSLWQPLPHSQGSTFYLKKLTQVTQYSTCSQFLKVSSKFHRLYYTTNIKNIEPTIIKKYRTEPRLPLKILATAYGKTICRRHTIF